tara:strand:- start:43 stop:306 length:264 start_codon:yes stop_codon:yes gene_type:complete
MSDNKEEIKNKIIYRASYRGSKEMDILMIAFVNSIINDLNYEELNHLSEFINMDDKTLMSIKNDNLLINFDNNLLFNLVERFKKFNL